MFDGVVAQRLNCERNFGYTKELATNQRNDYKTNSSMEISIVSPKSKAVGVNTSSSRLLNLRIKVVSETRTEAEVSMEWITEANGLRHEMQIRTVAISRCTGDKKVIKARLFISSRFHHDNSLLVGRYSRTTSLDSVRQRRLKVV